MLIKSVLTTLLFFVATIAGAAPRIGEPAPGFTGVDTRGNSHSLSDFRGTPVILEWTNHILPPGEEPRSALTAGSRPATRRTAATSTRSPCWWGSTESARRPPPPSWSAGTSGAGGGC